MTYKELCDEVAALGFESGIDSEDVILAATRRALQIIFTERPYYQSAEIYQPKITPSVKLDVLVHRGGDVDRFPFDSLAYSFKTSGVGSYKITDGGGERIHEFSENETLHRGFLHGVGELSFLGDYSYSVYDFALFNELYGSGVADIPIISGYKEYDISSYTEDFSSFVRPPADANGAAIPGASVRGSKISIPDSHYGKIRLLYKRAPSKEWENSDKEILLPEACEHLLPLLVGAYVWLDDDADKAQYYMSLYREAISAAKYYDRAQISTEYLDTNGWA